MVKDDSNTEKGCKLGYLKAIGCEITKRALCEQRKQIREWLKEILPKSYMSSDVPEIILKEFDEMKL